jgi:hypothetical protein
MHFARADPVSPPNPSNALTLTEVIGAEYTATEKNNTIRVKILFIEKYFTKFPLPFGKNFVTSFY